jgi:SulP family sulfate permease
MQFTPKLFSVLKDGYSLKTCRNDLIAGLTVAIVSLPLSMALAIASGASPDKGLITAIVAGLLVSLLGGSRVQISGPTGAFVVIVFNGIAQHGYDGLLVATLMAGFILLAAGYLRFGRVINFFPHSVITGFTSGIAVIIASSQIKDFFGLKIDSLPAEFIPKWVTYFGSIHSISYPTLLIGAASLAIIILMRHFTPKLPGYLFVVVAAAVTVRLFEIPTDTICTRFPDIPSGLPLPSFPEMSLEKIKEVVPLAFTIAFLAGIESLLSAVVADSMTGFKHRPNQELVATGIANIASTLFGGLPATGAIARTATNIKAGATTPVAGLFNGFFIMIFVLFAMKYMAFVPMAALAAILFIVAWGMSEVHQFIHILRLSHTDRLLLLLTFFCTILVDLTVAISLGIIVASLLFMRQMSKSVAISADNNGDNGEEENQRMLLPPKVEVFKISGPLFFAVAGDLIDSLRPIGKMPKVLIVRMPLVPYLDGTGASALKNLIKDCHAKGTAVVLSGLQEQPLEMLNNAGIHHGEQSVFFADNYPEAVNLTREICSKQK